MSDTAPQQDKHDDFGAEARALTWAALLGKWTDLARAAVALPPGDRWRSAVAPAIELQAVTCALSELDQLSPDERPLALDRASVLIERSEKTLRTLWGSDPLPPGLVALIEDAHTGMRAATTSQS